MDDGAGPRLGAGRGRHRLQVAAGRAGPPGQRATGGTAARVAGAGLHGVRGAAEPAVRAGAGAGAGGIPGGRTRRFLTWASNTGRKLTALAQRKYILWYGLGNIGGSNAKRA